MPVDKLCQSLDCLSSLQIIFSLHCQFIGGFNWYCYHFNQPSIAILTIYIASNQLTSLPALPNSLTTLDCYNNQLTSLPALPNSLTYLNCITTC
ncbi:MAG: leucine-rich repeat domain-containing protein [Bacteroidetes bacterium]|nr:leucine-rich repeat domain-containing protein [Bacteroidota bacterium]